MSTFKSEKFTMESLNALFEYATEGIVITDSKSIIIKANPSSEKLFGYHKDELHGKVIEDLIPDRYRHKHLSHRDGYHKNPHARSMGTNMDLWAKRKDGSEFPVEVSLSYYKQQDQTFVIAFIIDITERRRQEENIKRMNSELEKKVEERTQVLHEALIELEKSKEQLSRALENEKGLNDMKSRFVTMASHEFRTPLSTILSSISLINRYNETIKDEKTDKHVVRIKSAVTNMTLILNDFLSAEKLEEGKISVKKERIDLEQLTENILSEIQGILKTGQSIDYAHEGQKEAMLDQQIIRNILLNMVSNAIKFSPEQKPIRLKTVITPNTITIIITDEGIGIPQEEQEHLFERFFRAKNVTNIQGTGLGLNIVGKYLDVMNGKIEFKSELDKGTEFIIKIPNE